jgi:nitroreductase
MSTAAAPAAALKSEWFDAIASRVSRRSFDGRKVDSAVLDRVEETCRRVSEGRSARAVLVRNAPQSVFTGFVGSYGKVAGAPSLVAFVGSDDSLIELGFVGESVILDATLAGLDTCWIAGTFSAETAASVVDLAPGERVCAVTPLGYAKEAKSGAERLATAFMKPRARLAIAEIAPGCDSWPAWAREATEAVRLAPSGINKQPWRLRFEGGALVLGSAQGTYWTAPMDFGIAMLHAQLGALRAGIRGSWEALSGPDIARFTPAEKEGS